MRRMLSVVLLGAVLLAPTACRSNDNDNDGGNDSPATATSPTPGGGGSSEETCAAIDEVMGDFQTELVTAGAALSAAAATGDEAAIEEAGANLLTVAGESADRLRDIAANSDDPELRTAVEDAATEVENLAGAFAADPEAVESLDTTAFDNAVAAIEEECGPA
jgi:hypothetical protein